MNAELTNRSTSKTDRTENQAKLLAMLQRKLLPYWKSCTWEIKKCNVCPVPFSTGSALGQSSAIACSWCLLHSCTAGLRGRSPGLFWYIGIPACSHLTHSAEKVPGCSSHVPNACHSKQAQWGNNQPRQCITEDTGFHSWGHSVFTKYDTNSISAVSSPFLLSRFKLWDLFVVLFCLKCPVVL